MGTTDRLIEIEKLINRFGSHVVHQDLDFVLYRDEIFGLVGGSGSGKSVLLRTILGLRAPQGGQVRFGGQDMQRLPAAQKRALQRSWGVLFQDGALFSGLTVFDNIALPLREHTDIRESMIRELVMFKIEMVGLAPEAALKKPSDLSGGMARRAGLARALALDPEILFLDEPTSGLDPVAAAAFDELILGLRAALDLSVLLITHDLDTLVTVCDRIGMLTDKKIVSGTLDDMMRSDNKGVRAYFDGPRMRALPARPGNRGNPTKKDTLNG